MKRNISILSFLALIAICIVLLPSCRKSAFPRDPYRGASANPASHPPKHDKAKRTRPYRNIRAKPSAYRY